MPEVNRGASTGLVIEHVCVRSSEVTLTRYTSDRSRHRGPRMARPYTCQPSLGVGARCQVGRPSESQPPRVRSMTCTSYETGTARKMYKERPQDAVAVASFALGHDECSECPLALLLLPERKSLALARAVLRSSEFQTVWVPSLRDAVLPAASSSYRSQIHTSSGTTSSVFRFRRATSSGLHRCMYRHEYAPRATIRARASTPPLHPGKKPRRSRDLLSK